MAKKFLVDVDDVLRSLVPHMVELYNKEFNDSFMTYDDVRIYYVNQSFPKVAEKYGDATHWFFQEHGHELFYDSEPIKGAVDAVNKLREYGTVEIVTKQRSTKNSSKNWTSRANGKGSDTAPSAMPQLPCPRLRQEKRPASSA